MKKLIFLMFSIVSVFAACKKDDSSNVKTVQLDQPFSLSFKQTAGLDGEDWRIRFLGITEDSRCPTDVLCFWAGRVVAEFEVAKGGETIIKTLTDNPENDPSLSTTFTAFDHTVKLIEVTPYPDGSVIPQKKYVVKIEVQ